MIDVTNHRQLPAIVAQRSWSTTRRPGCLGGLAANENVTAMARGSVAHAEYLSAPGHYTARVDNHYFCSA